MSLRASSGEREAKNRYREYAQRFFGVDNVLDLFNFSSLKRDLSKKLLPFDANLEQRFF